MLGLNPRTMQICRFDERDIIWNTHGQHLAPVGITLNETCPFQGSGTCSRWQPHKPRKRELF